MKKRRKIEATRGGGEEQRMEDEEEEDGWEEYIDLIFPEDQAESKNLKILEMARKWKQEEK